MLPIKDHNPSNKFPFVTISLILVNIFAFYLELTALNTEAFIETYALIPATVNFLNFNSLFPFIYSMFLHAGFVHIGSNMWFLWIFGDNVEANWGHLRFLLIYLVWGVIAGLAQYLINPSSTIPMVGASGAVAGVLGSYLVMHPRAKIETLVASFGGFLHRLNIPAYFMLGYWFITQLFSGTASVVAGMQTGGVAFFAHIGGFVSGYMASKIKTLNNVNSLDDRPSY